MCRVFRGDWRFWRGFSQSLLLWSILMRLEFFLGSQSRLKSHFMGTGPEDGGNTKLHLEVQEVVPCVLEEQVLRKKKRHTFSNGTFNIWHFLNIILWICSMFAHLTRSRSIVLSRQSSCATTAWLAELVYSREATSLATCRRVFPNGSSSTPRVVSMGFR